MVCVEFLFINCKGSALFLFHNIVEVPQSELEVLKRSEPVRRRLVNDYFKLLDQLRHYVFVQKVRRVADGMAVFHTIKIAQYAIGEPLPRLFNTTTFLLLNIF